LTLANNRIIGAADGSIAKYHRQSWVELIRLAAEKQPPSHGMECRPGDPDFSHGGGGGG
jgi:hypothetical protein